MAKNKGKDPSTPPLRGSAQDDKWALPQAGVGPCGGGATSSAAAAAPSPQGEGRGHIAVVGGKERWTLRQDLLRDGVLQLYIYGDVEGDWYDWWSGQTVESETSADHFREELGKYPDAREIEIFINSYGGEVFEGTAIYNQLRRHPAHKTVRIDGFACSIASVIAMAGDEVIMPRNTLMMIHNMWMGAVGNAAQLRKAADDLDVINAAGRQAYLEKAGDKLDEAELIAMMDAETWLTAEDCIRLGLADKFADEDADLSAAGAILQKVNDGLERQVERNRAIAARLREVGETPAGGADSGAPCGAAEKDAPPVAPGPEAEVNPAPEKKPDEKPKDAPGGLMAFLAGVEF
ncbi:MAG: ATP-dependent Clp protease proteolytic subunit [Oscillospiraceae bacterium]|nr:ATP-dependent Clp protease proteolytic subunit [Oscillospiraceae bacterium]